MSSNALNFSNDNSNGETENSNSLVAASGLVAKRIGALFSPLNKILHGKPTQNEVTEYITSTMTLLDDGIYGELEVTIQATSERNQRIRKELLALSYAMLSEQESPAEDESVKSQIIMKEGGISRMGVSIRAARSEIIPLRERLVSLSYSLLAKN